MIEHPKQLNTETDSEYALFLEYLAPQNGITPLRSIDAVKTDLSPPQLRAIAQRNQWVSRAIDWDVAQLKERHTPKPSPAEIVANALIKLAGSTLAGSTKTDETTITKAVKLINGYRKLK